MAKSKMTSPSKSLSAILANKLKYRLEQLRAKEQKDLEQMSALEQLINALLGRRDIEDENDLLMPAPEVRTHTAAERLRAAIKRMVFGRKPEQRKVRMPVQKQSSEQSTSNGFDLSIPDVSGYMPSAGDTAPTLMAKLSALTSVMAANRGVIDAMKGMPSKALFAGEKANLAHRQAIQAVASSLRGVIRTEIGERQAQEKQADEKRKELQQKKDTHQQEKNIPKKNPHQRVQPVRKAPDKNAIKAVRPSIAPRMARMAGRMAMGAAVVATAGAALASSGNSR